MPGKEPIISDIGPSSLLLTWMPAKLPTGSWSTRPVTYRIEMREPPSGHWMPVAERLATTSFMVNFLNPDKDYMFRVFAELDGVESEPTASAYLPHRMGRCDSKSLWWRRYWNNCICLSVCPSISHSVHVFYFVQTISPEPLNHF